MKKSVLGAVGAAVSGIWRGTLNAALPPLCPLCKETVSEVGTLCPFCWSKVRFIAPPVCDCCGKPFEFAQEGERLCADCEERPAFPGRCRAAMTYDKASRSLILQFKHADRTELAPVLAGWMARAGGDVLAGADYLVPAPLHRWRLLFRRYNQAALLAKRLSALTGTPVLMDCLLRVRSTPPQGKGGKRWRAGNVKNAFCVANAARIEGRRLVLIDDMRASGATATECARILLAHGAKSVDLLTAGRADDKA